MNNNKLLFVFVLLGIVVGCTHQSTAQREVAAESCLNKLKPEYHSYFDSFEKCLDNSTQK